MMRNVIALAFLVHFAYGLTAQDDSRLGVKIGVSDGLVARLIDEDLTMSNKHLSIIRSFPTMNGDPFIFGLEFSQLNIERNYRGRVIEDDALTVAMVAGSQISLLGPINIGVGIHVEYDLSKVDSPNLYRTNGLGLYMNLNFDIHLTDTYVLTIFGDITVRDLIPFTGVEDFIQPARGSYSSSGLSAMVSYKFW